MTLDAWDFELQENAFLYEIFDKNNKFLGKFVLSGHESQALKIISEHLKILPSLLNFKKEEIKILF